MVDNEKFTDHSGQKTERNIGRPCTSRVNEQKTLSKAKHKVDESDLPVPPPDPWASLWRLQNTRNQAEIGQSRNVDEDEDIIAYLTDFGTLPFEGQTSECPSRNSAMSAMAISSLYAEDAFEQLDRLYAFAEEILELRDRNSKFFRRVRNLERLKVLRNANQKLENAFERDKDATINVCEEDTGFAESLLDAMLSNCRDSPFQKRNIRSSSSRQTRNKFDVDKQTSTDEISGSAPKVSKWTRVKAAFKWERAYTNDTETMDPSMTTSTSSTTTASPSTPTTKYHRNADVEIKESNNTATSSPVNEPCNTGPLFGSSPSSFNEGFYDCSQKSALSHLDYQSLKRKSNKEADYGNWHSKSLDDNILILDTLQVNETGLTNEIGQGKPLIRITSDNDHAMLSSNKIDEKDTESTSKRSTPTLTITIPSHDEDNRYVSSPESNSPLFFNTNTSAGNSPQPRKTYRDLSINKDFKRQRSYGGESAILSSKAQRSDSKWNKVRRAFLTNSTSSISSNFINVVSRQMLFQDGLEASIGCNHNDSVENIEKATPSNAQVGARRDYRVLREKLGTEFYQKLIEWERLKNLPPRVATKEVREISPSLPSPRESLLSEERLAPEFRKKLQDWKRAKKVRRGSAPFEQQRIKRRRLTDWQLWRSPSKTEHRNREIATPQVNSECGDIVNEGKSQLCEDFARKVENSKRTNETGNHDSQYSIRSKSHQHRIASGIDETEFFVLERLLSFFNNNTIKERRGCDAQRLEECFDADSRSYADGTQSLNDSNEVFVRTSVGSYRFEGISREFTRKLYDWERYRGISPTSSTFRLLGPPYIPSLRRSTIETSTNSPTSNYSEVGSNEPVLLKGGCLKRSKSVGAMIEKTDQTAFFVRRSNSLRSLDRLTNRSKDLDRVDILPDTIDSRRTEDVAEDIMDDSEPEAMIVDIEDVIEETASPLERVQPHQTPVYSVAASETTSIAVPLGTVTSSHEPSPVFLIEIEENSDHNLWKSNKWSQRKSFSSEDSLSLEQSETTKSWNNEKISPNNEEPEHWFSASSTTKKQMSGIKEELDKDSVKSSSSICSTDGDTESNVMKEEKKIKDQSRVNFEREDVPVTSAVDKEAIGRDAEKHVSDEQSKIATCRYNQELSSEKEHEQRSDNQAVGKDESGNSGKDGAETTNKLDNEYEEIILATSDPPRCSLTNTQSMANCKKETTPGLPKTPNVCELDEVKPATREVDLFYANRRDDSLKKIEENYSIVEEELDIGHDSSETKLHLNNYKSCNSFVEYSNREKQDCSIDATTSARSVERRNWREYRNMENVSTSSQSSSTNSCTRECRREPTIETTAYTVAPSSEERCFERIIINEETLNKIVVPTASTGCVEKTKSSKTPVERATTENSESSRRSSSDHDVPTNQESNVKKQVSSSPTRNVFIRTKRIIFSPFRRSEEHSAKKEDACEDDQVFTRKSKSKSRSGSPKVNRQDALLRMSLSLPWPLRPSSKDREAKETKVEGNGKEERASIEKPSFERCKSVESSRKSSTSESNAFPRETKRDRASSTELPGRNGEFNQAAVQKSQRADVSVQAKPGEQQNQASFGISLPSLKTQVDEKIKDASSSKFDPQSSDLIHKLTILSNVVARRDGRTNTISEDTSLESHSLRVRRAKEDFLSRRGGPLCHSVLEPPSIKHQISPRTFPHRYEQISENQEKATNKSVSDVNRTPNSSSNEASDDRGAQEEATNEKKVEQFIKEYNANELSNSPVSRPDRVKSASAGMINVDPDTFVRLTETSRGCESLPRSISKQQQPLGSFAKIVNKFKFTRLIRGKDIQEENMSTISKLCRQSLLIDVRNDFDKCWESSDREKASKQDSVGRSKKNE
ncbi:uncharacterized protein LOC132912195 isoform X3 [Bombus pascuorum]|uniref:uncharacterized protein LOC132912195 isoform X3 n=1 Tax=Bombus pascuorum TaxID=65598 RepID=UPI00298ECB5A|nr:uncharacterized protein LOC132912195 isoform X3 [Bombus pascuorum]